MEAPCGIHALYVAVLGKVGRRTAVDDSAKTRDELIDEVQRLRRQVAERQTGGKQPICGTHSNDAALLHTILANVPIIIFALDRNGIITLSEGRGLETLGLQPKADVGRSLFEVHPEVPGVGEMFQRFLTSESGCDHIELGGVTLEIWHTPLRNSQAETVGMAGIAIDVTQRELAEQQLRREQHLMQRMLESHEQDRRLIACEIHDGLVQDATAAQMQLEALLQTGKLPPGPDRETVHMAAELVRKSVVEARQLIGGLRPPILDELGIVPAIEYLVEGRRDQGLSIELSVEVQFDRLEPLLEATIYRIVQEAVGNVVRHSGSRRAAIRLKQAGDQIHVEVEDWGVGFDPAEVSEKRFGLQGIRERARLLRGRASIDSVPGKGTRVFVDLPIAYALGDEESAMNWSDA